jgi:hypothetical protein
MSTVRVYVNGRGIDAPAGGSALDAVRLADPELAERIAAGARGLTDSRGLPVPAQAALYEGAIFRVVSARGGEGPSA